MFDKKTPFALEDIFSLTFRLFKKTWSRNIIIVCIFLVPAGIFLAYGIDIFLSAIIKLVEENIGYETGEADLKAAFEILGVFSLYFFSLLVFGIASFMAKIGIAKTGYGELDNNRVSVSGAMQTIFSITFWRSLGQQFLMYLIIFAIIFAAILFAILAGVVSAANLVIAIVLLVVGTLALTFYLSFRWYFAFYAIVCEGKGIMISFTESSRLVKKHWWRTFGIILLLSFALEFALSIITTPLSFVLMWDFIMKYFELVMQGAGGNIEPDQILPLFESMGFSLGILIVVSTMLKMIISPLFEVVMFLDLKIRHHDYEEIENTTEEIPSVNTNTEEPQIES